MMKRASPKVTVKARIEKRLRDKLEAYSRASEASN